MSDSTTHMHLLFILCYILVSLSYNLNDEVTNKPASIIELRDVWGDVLYVLYGPTSSIVGYNIYAHIYMQTEHSPIPHGCYHERPPPLQAKHCYLRRLVSRGDSAGLRLRCRPSSATFPPASSLSPGTGAGFFLHGTDGSSRPSLAP